MSVSQKQHSLSLTPRQVGPDVVVSGVDCLDLALTLDCGQAFRWEPLGDGRWHGIAGSHPLTVGMEDRPDGGKGLVLYHTDLKTYHSFWRHYFDLDRDYNPILQAMELHPVLAQAAQAAWGIRLLRQEPWETLCSFIISQNNNIPRIKGIIRRLCETFGPAIESPDGGIIRGFPAPCALASQTLDALAPLRAGFRAKYILDAARKVTEGTINLAALSAMPLATARDQLMQIKGVGPKVADCVLLFGAGHLDAFPADVWIKRAMQALFGGKLPTCAVPYAGIVQQYIFHYARITKLKTDQAGIC